MQYLHLSPLQNYLQSNQIAESKRTIHTVFQHLLSISSATQQLSAVKEERQAHPVRFCLNTRLCASRVAKDSVRLGRGCESETSGMCETVEIGCMCGTRRGIEVHV